jgi:hypothetical protein
MLDITSLNQFILQRFTSKTGNNPVQYKIAFVYDQHNLLMGIFLIYSKTESHMVPKGLRVSRMCRMTSEESITSYNSPYMRREVPLAYISDQ